MAVNILLVEDESIVRKDIEKRLVNLGYTVIAQADNGKKALDLAREFKPDLALLDIQIKGSMTGIDVAEELRKEMDIPIIYLTANADEATIEKAKYTEPHGYILKPFQEVNLRTTIEMAMHKHSREMEVRVENNLLRSLTEFKSNASYLFIKYQSKLVRLETKDIYYVEALKDYMQVVTKDIKYIIHATMKDMERKLSKTEFQRVHRSYIVNMEKITYISGGEVVLEDIAKEISVGGNYRDELAARINVL